MLTPADDQMVEQPDVQEPQGLLQTLCDFAVGFARLWIAARMVVQEDDSHRFELKSALCHDSRVNIAPVDGAGEDVLGC